MNRRRFLVTSLTGALAAPRTARAQGERKLPRIGVLYMNRPVSPSGLPPSFWERMSELGWVDGQTLRVELRGAAGDPKRLRILAAELIDAKVDVIAMDNGTAAKALQERTAPTPICVAGADLQVAGVVKNIARPEGNITGVQVVQAELAGKRLSLLKEMIPGVTRVGVLLGARTVPVNASLLRAADEAARALGLEVHVMELLVDDDVDRAFLTLSKLGAHAVLVVNNPVLTTQVDRVQALATKARLAAMYEYRSWAAAGGLVSYGPSSAEIFRQLADCVDKILRGARPSDIPVQQPTKFELVINMKTAKTLGLTIPPPVLLRADHLIE